MGLKHLGVLQTLLILVAFSDGDCGCGKLSRSNLKLAKKGSTIVKAHNRTGDTCEILRYQDVMDIVGQYPKRGRMVFIRAGKFTMGNNDDELHPADGEAPERQVYVSCHGL